jgi:hypothetical protein
VITALFAPYIGYIMAALTALVGLLLARKSGKDAIRVETAIHDAERSEAVLSEIKRQQEAIHRAGSISRDDINDSLHDHRF